MITDWIRYRVCFFAALAGFFAMVSFTSFFPILFLSLFDKDKSIFLFLSVPCLFAFVLCFLFIFWRYGIVLKNKNWSPTWKNIIVNSSIVGIWTYLLAGVCSVIVSFSNGIVFVYGIGFIILAPVLVPISLISGLFSIVTMHALIKFYKVHETPMEA